MPDSISIQSFQAVAQTGGIGIALVTLWILWKLLTTLMTANNQVVKENTESNIKLVAVLTSHTEVLRSLGSTIERKLK